MPRALKYVYTEGAVPVSRQEGKVIRAFGLDCCTRKLPPVWRNPKCTAAVERSCDGRHTGCSTAVARAYCGRRTLAR